MTGDEEPGKPPILSDEGTEQPPVLRDEGSGRPPVLRQEADDAPHTIGRPEAGCGISAVFRLLFTTADGGQGNILLSKTGGEVTVDPTTTIRVQAKIISVGPFGGTASFSYSRTAQGAQTPRPPGPLHAGDMAGLKQQLSAAQVQDFVVPPGIDARNPQTVETITATATWSPDAGGSCSVTEQVNVVWLLDHGNPTLALHVSGDKTTTGVSVGKTVKPGDPDRVPTMVFYAVADANNCCGTAGGYAVIQFVRHQWDLKEDPPRKGTDHWTLDVLDSEVRKAAAGEPFDPTFTHDPGGTSPNTPPVVYPGPNPEGGSSITQVDAPGIPADLYNRFSRAGGKFAWRLYSFLVCKLNPSTAQNYLAQCRVSQSVCYQIELTFDGSGAAPVVAAKLISGPNTYNPCRALKGLLEELDRGRTRGDGQLIHGYDHPRGHQIAI